MQLLLDKILLHVCLHVSSSPFDFQFEDCEQQFDSHLQGSHFTGPSLAFMKFDGDISEPISMKNSMCDEIEI